MCALIELRIRSDVLVSVKRARIVGPPHDTGAGVTTKSKDGASPCIT